MVTDYTTTGGSFSSNKVRVWSDRQTRTVGTYVSFGLAPDGKRFAVFPTPESTAEDKGAAHVTFLLNFFDELRRRVPLEKDVSLAASSDHSPRVAKERPIQPPSIAQMSLENVTQPISARPFTEIPEHFCKQLRSWRREFESR